MTNSKPPYRLVFHEDALTEWRKLDKSIKEQFKRRLDKLCNGDPKVPKQILHGRLKGCYKIKLQASGFRLVYKVDDGVLRILVLAVGSREDSAAYKEAEDRL